MTQGLQEIDPQAIAAELESVLLPRLRRLLSSRGPGHCMRITDLDTDLMARLCGRLRAEVPGTEIVMLGGGDGSLPRDLTVSSTKLVELRNPLPDGTLRPPLLAFIPNDVRAAAEDSFGVATFEQVQLGDVYGELRQKLLDEMPPDIRGDLAEALRRITDGDSPWGFADPVAVVRFLLTAKANDNDPEAIGAALYELALVPDFELLAMPDRAPLRISRNRECVEKLTWSAKSERGRVLDLGLTSSDMRNRLGDFFTEAGLEDPRTWTRRIVIDRNHWSLAFNRWEFDSSSEPPDSICISEVTASLPIIEEGETDPRLSQLIGQRVLALGSKGLQKFNVAFRVDPQPSTVPGLASFFLQVISQEQGPIGLVRTKKAWTSKRPDATVSFTRINTVGWEEGWHFIRVLARTEVGDFIPLVDTAGSPILWAADDDDPSQQPNESDLFYVLPDGDVDIEPPQRARQREVGLVHARTRLQFTALIDGRDPEAVAVTSVNWTERAPGARSVGSEMLEVDFGRDGTMNVPVSRQLKALEQRILAAPAGPINWRIPIALGSAGQASGETSRWPQGEATSRFLAAREAYFQAVRAGATELVTQAADVRALRPLISEYADAYRLLIQGLLKRAETATTDAAQHALADLRRVLAVDTVTLAIRNHRGRRREAALVAPTHPLRALWLAVWAQLTQIWLQRAKRAPREFAVPTREALLRGLAPIGFPPVLPMANGRLLAAVDNLHPFWTLYAPPHEQDPRSLVGDVCDALGLPEPATAGTSINGAYLASRVQRYLVQHPYVRTLMINAFNPGRAGLLADMLLELQRQPAIADIRYDIRLFAPDADAPGLGEALGELLSPTPSVTAREADAFAAPTETHLRPKLALAVRPTADFRRSPNDHPAHLSILFDLFPAEEVGVARASIKESVSPVHGLVQEFHVEYRDDEATVAWARQPRHGQAVPIDGAEELTDLLSTLPGLVSTATATVSTGETELALRPVITLALDAEDRSILHQVHEVSDWVLTLDRNMGIEFFDHGGLSDRPDYLIDHSPETTGQGHRLVITSRSVAELEAILKPVLDQYHLKADSAHAVALLNQLRSLSGRLALKLISSPTQRAEALGLALSRLFLEHQGVFANQVVVPLDAHLDLYRAIKRNSDELGDEVSFRRTDLALFDLDARARTITCRLVEVKCYNQVGDLGAYNQLKSDIAEQIAQSEEVIGYHFDPHRSLVDRPDRLMKTRELSTLLEFYLNRSVRYGAMTGDAAEEAHFLLRTLEDGYRLDFARAALIFDFDKPGTEPAELDAGIEYHRVGANLIQQLIDAAAPEPMAEEEEPDPARGEERAESTAARSIADIARRRERAPSVPTLDSAAFLSPPRDRTVSWEDLAARRTLGDDDLSLPQDARQRDDAELAEDGQTLVDLPGDTRPDGSQPMQIDAVTDGSAASTWPEKPVLAESETPKSPDDEDVPTPSAAGAAAGDFEPGQPGYDVLIGATSPSPQYGILGEMSGRKVALDLNQTHTISLFGVQGGGKSYTLGTIAEMASLPIPNLNRLPHPLATVIFHYSPTMDYKPEFTTMIAANTDEAQIDALRERYGAQPRALSDVLLLVPADKLDERRTEYPGIEVRPLKFAAAELQASHWRFLMGAVGNQATYMRQVNRVMKGLRHDLTLEGIREGIDNAPLPDHLKAMAGSRLDLAAEYIDDSTRLSNLIRPGRLVIVDLRDEFIEKDEALGLFVVLLQLFADAKHGGKAFNKLVVFDEAHKYIESPDLVAGLVEVVREMRHKGTSIMVASQDPPSVPVSLIELSSQIILHKFNSPAWLKHIQKANAALTGLTADKMAHLRPGEAYIWSSRATDETFSKGAVKIRCRPRVTQHGGDTKTAVTSADQG
ncbi:hypothetical protein GCM10027280_26400 [Micromonospora polyrhachis]|uniref:Cyclic nucleotide-binding domain-containing protein n=1 Tax=Micromonospora polyrhachis TaxID=1282883 RepID=A0A7W7SQ85_9ACTN|nr:ATP-binding protein [Micromonospora polyrhachis]MBB4957735.1 hypothetical protein [Micromonospora polyrhachis]